MIILKMRASFGSLNGELSLHEGLNVLCMPNEAGKSTWSAFVLAMLYGIDTKEKASSLNNHLPAKERYKPWDGRPMQGMMELFWNGRRITIERQSRGKLPMGIFKAYDTDSGAPISELTADNCGQMLCGVERSVFERTAFIRQSGLSVSEDHALEKRLNTLVTTGEEGRSASEIADALHKLRVKLSHPSNGRIARLKAQITHAQQQKTAVQKLQEDALSLQSQVAQMQAQTQQLSALLTRIEKARQAEKHTALSHMEQKLRLQESQYAAAQEKCAAIPSAEELRALRGQLDEASNQLQTVKLEQAFSPEPPKRPQPQNCFIGLDSEQAWQQQTDDAKKYAAYGQEKAPGKLLLLVSALLCLSGIAYVPMLAVGALCILVSLTLYVRQSKKYHTAQHQREKILARYGVASIDQTELLAEQYEEQMRAYKQALASGEADSSVRAQRLQSAQTALDVLVRQVQDFAPACADVSQARQAIISAQQLHTELLTQRRSIELQREQLISMRQLLGDNIGVEADPEALRMDASKITYERNAASARLSDLQQKLAEQNGKISAAGDPALLYSKIEQYQRELAEAEQAEAVVVAAENAISRADEALRSRFSPRITAEAGKILAELTAQRYPNVLLRPDMTLCVREDGGTITHTSAAMSSGTADQMYFALRLAMVHCLLKNAPILLDDALVNFDDERTAAAIRLLTKESEQRQIILFTCKELT